MQRRDSFDPDKSKEYHIHDFVDSPKENGTDLENVEKKDFYEDNPDLLQLSNPFNHCPIVSESKSVDQGNQEVESLDCGLVECMLSPNMKVETSGEKPPSEAPSTRSHSSLENEKEPRKSTKNLTPQLFSSLPSANAEALQTFVEIQKCIYMNKSLGETNQHESMGCDCIPEWDGERNLACGEDSDCINRMTSMECTEDDCNCGEGCQNQRFQNAEYASVEVIKTELKGHGLRANFDLDKGKFIYEYVGDVIHEKEFRKRMIRYDGEGIKHFYFMMLQKGEFIDATQRGGLARFINHSCSPNCFVDKWVVGTKLRMGIFAKRSILAGEELTFDYNVDRYGAQAQPCYCDEPDCIGFIGGKTQTEAKSKIPDNVRAALGLEEDDEWDWETTTAKKRRKSKKADGDDEYINIQPREADEKGVTKIMSTLMQCKEQWMINKLLVRLQILEILLKWPRLTRNKISSSKIEDIVRELTERSNENIKTMAQNLLLEWSTLEMAYRIPKKRREIVDAQESSYTAESVDMQDDSKGSKITFINRQRWTGLSLSQPTFYVPKIQFKSQEEAHKTEKMDLQKIIDTANKQLAEKAALAQAEQDALEEKQKSRKEKKSEKRENKNEDNKRKQKDPEIIEKQLTKLFAKYVPNVIAKYSEHFEKEDLKKRAKEIVGILVQKEMRPGHQVKSLKEISDDKKKRIKLFSRTYMDKLVSRRKERAKHKGKLKEDDECNATRRQRSISEDLPEPKRIRSCSPVTELDHSPTLTLEENVSIQGTP